MTRSEFGEFLVARRAQLQPEDVGLPPARRRRTPGLRREEVAALAGVSVDYLARLEQGRDTNPSSTVLGALADALRLNEVERHHFGKLAFGRDRSSGCPGAGEAHEQVAETIRAVLDTLRPTPAFVVGRRLNLLAWNAAWHDFAEPLGLFDDVTEANVARYLFAHPMAPKLVRNWSDSADMYTSALRAARSHWTDDDGLYALIVALQQFPEFARRWHAHRVGPHRSGVLQIRHPERGDVEVEVETLDSTLDQSVMVWLVNRRRVQLPELRLVNE